MSTSNSPITRTRLYIGGEWRPASDGGVFPVEDPSTEQTIAEVASATVADVTTAVETAHEAGAEWARRLPRQRAEVLHRCWELLRENRQCIAECIVRENGKTLADASAEADYAAEFFRWYSEEAVRNYGEILTSPSGGHRIVVLQQPIGVSVLVTPWNFPAAMATRKIAPAIAAGCPVILKPASDTPLTALLVAEILAAAGVPPGVVNVVPSRRSGEVVDAMLHHLAGAQVVVHRFHRGRAHPVAGGVGLHRRLLHGTGRQRTVSGLRRCRHRRGGQGRHCSRRCATVARPVRPSTVSTHMLPFTMSLPASSPPPWKPSRSGRGSKRVCSSGPW